MPKNKPAAAQEMLQGTLDMLVLQTLILGPAHGHTIAHVIEHTSEDVLQVEQHSLDFFLCFQVDLVIRGSA